MAAGFDHRFDKPWDSPANLRTAGRQTGVFSCSWDRERTSRGVTTAAYVAVVGPDCVIRSEQYPARTLEDVPAQTIVLVETRLTDVPWTRPFDLSYERLVADRGYAASVIGGPHPGGGHYCCADGSRGRINDIGLDELLRRCVVPTERAVD